MGASPSPALSRSRRHPSSPHRHRIVFAVDRREPDRRPPPPAAVARVRYQLPVNVEVVDRHAARQEPLLEVSPHTGARQLDDALRRRDRLVQRVDDVARDPVAHHLRHRAASKRDHRRTAGHRLDHHQPERLRPVDREQQRRRVAQEVVLLRLADLTHELDARVGHHGFDLRLEVFLILLVDLGGDLQRHAQPHRDVDRAIEALLGRHPAQKRQVAPRPRPCRIQLGRQPVVHGRAPAPHRAAARAARPRSTPAARLRTCASSGARSGMSMRPCIVVTCGTACRRTSPKWT